MRASVRAPIFVPPIRVLRDFAKSVCREETVDFRHNYIYIVHMNDLIFEWDQSKNKSNAIKHGVSFEEAQTVFLDENAVRFFDPDHSDDEDRFIMLGMSARLRILVVCHCLRKNDAAIRIISARKADKREARNYEEAMP